MSLSTVDVMTPLSLYITTFILESNKLNIAYTSFKL